MLRYGMVCYGTVRYVTVRYDKVWYGTVCSTCISTSSLVGRKECSIGYTEFDDGLINVRHVAFAFEREHMLCFD